jgi:hypothetical protein
MMSSALLLTDSQSAEAKPKMTASALNAMTDFI